MPIVASRVAYDSMVLNDWKRNWAASSETSLPAYHLYRYSIVFQSQPIGVRSKSELARVAISVLTLAAFWAMVVPTSSGRDIAGCF